jgi:Skp family chaperone for outer membrane proteins
MQVRMNSFQLSWRSWGRNLLVLGALLGGAVNVRPVQAQNATVGVVDGAKINDGYTSLKTALDTIDKRKQALRTQLDARTFLTEGDAKRFDVLIVKTNRSDAENQEVEKLVKTGTDRRNDYNTLVGKATKTDEDRSRIKSMEDESQKSIEAFQGVVKSLDDAVTKQEMDTEEDFRGRIIKAVEAVANERKLVLVVGKQAIAWNSQTIEITDEVLTRLNKS